jgi:hypothetical protein
MHPHRSLPSRTLSVFRSLSTFTRAQTRHTLFEWLLKLSANALRIVAQAPTASRSCLSTLAPSLGAACSDDALHRRPLCVAVGMSLEVGQPRDAAALARVTHAHTRCVVTDVPIRPVIEPCCEGRGVCCVGRVEVAVDRRYLSRVRPERDALVILATNFGAHFERGRLLGVVHAREVLRLGGLAAPSSNVRPSLRFRPNLRLRKARQRAKCNQHGLTWTDVSAIVSI